MGNACDGEQGLKLELRYSLENGLLWEPKSSREPMVGSHRIQLQTDFRYLMVMTIMFVFVKCLQSVLLQLSIDFKTDCLSTYQ